MARRASSSSDAPLAAAMACSGAITGQDLIAKAAAEGIYFDRFDKSTYWKIVLATSVVSIVLAIVNARASARVSPSRRADAVCCQRGALRRRMVSHHARARYRGRLAFSARL